MTLLTFLCTVLGDHLKQQVLDFDCGRLRVIETYTSTTKTKARHGGVLDGAAVIAEAVASLLRLGMRWRSVVVRRGGLSVDGGHWRRLWNVWSSVELTKRLRWWVSHAMALVLLYRLSIFVISRILV